MARRLPPYIGLGDLRDVDRAHDAAAHAPLLDGALDGQRVYDGAKHPHVVGGGRLDADLLGEPPAPDVAGSHHYPNLGSGG